MLPIIIGIVGSLVAGGAYLATRKPPSEAPPGAPPEETAAERAKTRLPLPGLPGVSRRARIERGFRISCVRLSCL